MLKAYIMKNELKCQLDAVACKIRDIRLERNYSQEYLAIRLAISQNAYSKIELGYTKLTLERLLQIADVLEVETMRLLAA